MELKDAIEKLNNLIKNANIEDIDMNDIFGGEHIEAINTVLEELDNRIPRKDIEDKINEFIEKPLLDIEETEKFKFEYTLDGLYAIKYGVIHILNELLKDKE